MMSTILDEVRQMVCSLPMREVNQSVLDEKVDILAPLLHFRTRAKSQCRHIMHGKQEVCFV
ncbi:hypothetical protein OROMI_025847 [Orobanche minor]